MVVIADQDSGFFTHKHKKSKELSQTGEREMPIQLFESLKWTMYVKKKSFQGFKVQPENQQENI